MAAGSCVAAWSWEDVGARLRKKSGPRRLPRRPYPRSLQLHRVQALAADHLVLEIAADRAGIRKPLQVRGHRIRPERISAFEIDGDRKLDRRRHPRRIGQSEIEGQRFGVLEAVRRGHRGAAGRDRLGAGLGNRLRASGVPGIVERTARPAGEGRRRSAPFARCRHGVRL